MKRKYAAIMLGLALTLSSISAYAEAPDTAKTVETDKNNDSEVAEKELYGSITELTADSITLSTGTLENTENVNAGFTLNETPENSANTENTEDASADTDNTSADATSEDTEENTDAENSAAEENTDAENSAAEEDTDTEGSEDAVIFVLDGGEQTLTLTENTQFLREESVLPTEEAYTDDTDAEDTDTEDQTVDESSDTADENGAASDAETNEAATDASATDTSVTEEPAAEEPAADDSSSDSDTADDTDNEDDAQLKAISQSDLQTGDIVKITLDKDGNVAAVTVVMPYDEISSEETESAIEEIKPVSDASTEDSGSSSDETDTSETTANN